jgi:hypothetical protein
MKKLKNKFSFKETVRVAFVYVHEEDICFEIWFGSEVFTG